MRPLNKGVDILNHALARSGHHEPGRKSHAVTPGKRKRSAREKSVESGEVQLPIHTINSRRILKSLPSQVLSSGRSRTVSLGEEGAAGLERMEMEEGGFCSKFIEHLKKGTIFSREGAVVA